MEGRPSTRETRPAPRERPDLEPGEFELDGSEMSEVFDALVKEQPRESGEYAEVDLEETLPLQEESFADIMPELEAERAATRAQLEANEAKMRAAKEEEHKAAEGVITDVLKRGGTSEMQTTVLANFAVAYPKEVMTALVANKDSFDFLQKSRIAAKAVGNGAGLAPQLAELGFSDAEQRAMLIRIADEAPYAFMEASRAVSATLSREEKRALTLDIAERDSSAFADLTAEFGFSHEEVVGLIREFPIEQRKQVLEALRIPGSKNAKEYADITSTEIGRMIEEALRPEMRKDYEQMRKMERASRELMLAIAEEFPERAVEDRERYRSEQLLHGQIKEYGDLGVNSATSPLFVNIEGRELPAVYKPKGRELIPIKDDKGKVTGYGKLRAGIELGDMAPREALASLIDRAVGFNMVPVTVLRDGPEGVGSVQEWNVGQPGGQLEGNGGWRDPKYRPGLKRVGYVHYLMMASDGHRNNVIRKFDGSFGIIDNGSILAEQEYDKLMSEPLMVVKGERPPQDMQDKVTAFLGSRRVRRALQNAFDAAIGEKHGMKAYLGFIGRMRASVKEEFRLPDTEAGYDWMYEEQAKYEAWQKGKRVA